MIHTQRNFRIDLIRGISIFLVLFHHFNIAYRLDDTPLSALVGWDAIRALARNGNYGVTMFFVISGYLITSRAYVRWTRLADIQPRSFFELRAARILPCLLLLLAVVNLLAAAGVPIFQNRSPDGLAPSFWVTNLAALTFWMNVLIGHDGWFNYPLGVLWSLSVEEVFYVTFPLLCLALRGERRLFVLLGTLVLIGPVYRYLHQGDEGGYLYAYFASFDGIAIGCGAAILARYVSLNGWGGQALQAIAAALMAILYFCGPIGQTNILGVTSMALLTAVLLLGSHDKPTRPALLRSRVLAAMRGLGQRSYELYLFHLIVLGGLRTAFPPATTSGNTKLALLLAFLLLSAMVAGLIGRYYADPLNRWFRERLRASPRTAPQQG